ncbi:MAG: hypothetical protein ACLFS1_09705 [Opitutales bacterium]
MNPANLFCPPRPSTAARCLLLAALLLCPLLGVSEQSDEFTEIRAELDGPVDILLDNGNRQTGKIVHWDGDQLSLKVALGSGSARMSYDAGSIRRISFPGRDALKQLAEWTRDANRTEEALELFRAFYEQRGAFFEFLDPAELNLFHEYIRFALEHDKPLRAVAMIEVLRPHIEDPARLKALDDAVLLAFFKADMLQEAQEKAKAWIDTAPPAGDSALGWRILAEIQFREEAFEEALWTALYPIAFANQILPDHLDHCYALAIAAARETRQDSITERLTREMRQRELSWPHSHPLLHSYSPPPPEPENDKPDEPAQGSTKDLLDPIQTPSPLDPMQTLPTRIHAKEGS